MWFSKKVPPPHQLRSPEEYLKVKQEFQARVDELVRLRQQFYQSTRRNSTPDALTGSYQLRRRCFDLERALQIDSRSLDPEEFTVAIVFDKNQVYQDVAKQIVSGGRQYTMSLSTDSYHYKWTLEPHLDEIETQLLEFLNQRFVQFDFVIKHVTEWDGDTVVDNQLVITW